MLWPNLVLVVPLLYLYFTGWDGGFELRQWSIFLASTLFLNSVHHGFAVGMCIAVPEIRELIRRKYRGQRLGFWSRFLIIYSLSALYFLVIKEVLPFEINYFVYLSTWVVIDYLLAVYHQVSQTKGLTLLYNQKLLADNELSEPERARVRKMYSLEKALYGVLYACLAVQVIESAFEVRFASTGFLVLGVLAALGLLATAFRTQMSWRSNKTVFSTKAITFAFSSVFWPMHILTRINHGMEYLGIVNRMYRNSLGAKAQFLIYVGVFGGIATLLATFNYHTGIVALIRGEDSTPTVAFQVIHSLAFARSISHYYVDRVLFQFRHEENRKIILPLLFEPGPGLPVDNALEERRSPPVNDPVHVIV